MNKNIKEFFNCEYKNIISITEKKWGKFEVLKEKKGYKVKKLYINPGKSISLQFHNNREEYWKILSGTGEMLLGKEINILRKTFLKVGEKIYIPKGCIHKVKNIGNEILEILEVQVGEKISEEDIVRI